MAKREEPPLPQGDVPFPECREPPGPRHPPGPRCPQTLDSMPIFMMVPSTVRTSLTTRRMYQPLRNSIRSDRHTLWL